MPPGDSPQTFLIIDAPPGFSLIAQIAVAVAGSGARSDHGRAAGEADDRTRRWGCSTACAARAKLVGREG
jgi:hypothetical protein